MAGYVATTQWIKFFTKAGLPPNDAANYAIIFSDNRIQMDMLMDLSKEYLYDMGIKLMGDVIAILRHAKETHNQLTKEKVIGGCSEIDSSPVSAKRSTPASRMIGHYTRPAVSNSSSTGSPDASPKLPNLSVSEKGKTSVVNLKRKLDTQDPIVKRVRKVLPEEEGAYNIKFPSGTTERSRKILQQQKQQQQQQQTQGFKRSVFDRLGDSSVSSSTDSNNKSATIFGRLGPPGNSEVSTSTVSGESNVVQQSVQYQGVLKGGVNRRTVAAGKYPNDGFAVKIVGAHALAGARKFGLKPTSVSTVSTTTKGSNLTLASRLSRALNKSSNSISKNISHGIFGDSSGIKGTQTVKSRLGLSSSSGINIKDRLGRGPTKGKTLQLNRGRVVSGLVKPNVNRKVYNNLNQNVFQRLGR